GSAYPVRPGHGPRTAGSRTPDDRDGGAARGVPAAGRLEPDDIAAEPRHVDLEAGLPQGPLGVADGAPNDVRDRELRLAAVVAADLDRARVDEALALVDDDRDLVPSGDAGAPGRGLLDHRVRLLAVHLLLAHRDLEAHRTQPVGGGVAVLADEVRHGHAGGDDDGDRLVGGLLLPGLRVGADDPVLGDGLGRRLLRVADLEAVVLQGLLGLGQGLALHVRHLARREALGGGQRDRLSLGDAGARGRVGLDDVALADAVVVDGVGDPHVQPGGLELAAGVVDPHPDDRRGDVLVL